MSQSSPSQKTPQETTQETPQSQQGATQDFHRLDVPQGFQLPYGFVQQNDPQQEIASQYQCFQSGLQGLPLQGGVQQNPQMQPGLMNVQPPHEVPQHMQCFVLTGQQMAEMMAAGNGVIPQVPVFPVVNMVPGSVVAEANMASGENAAAGAAQTQVKEDPDKSSENSKDKKSPHCSKKEKPPPAKQVKGDGRKGKDDASKAMEKTRGNRCKIITRNGVAKFCGIYDVEPLENPQEREITIHEYETKECIRKSTKTKKVAQKICSVGDKVCIIGDCNSGDNAEVLIYKDDDMIYKRRWRDIKSKLGALRSVNKTVPVIAHGYYRKDDPVFAVKMNDGPNSEIWISEKWWRCKDPEPQYPAVAAVVPAMEPFFSGYDNSGYGVTGYYYDC